MADNSIEEEYQRQESQLNEEYLSDRQAGQYQNNTQFEQEGVFVNSGNTDQMETIVFVYGKYLPDATSSTSKKHLLHIKRYFYFFMDEIVNQKYIIFYFHSGLYSYASIQCLYTIMKDLPPKYYNNLQKLYIVHPSFLLKSFNFFSVPVPFKAKLEYLKSLKNVYELKFFKKQFFKKIQAYVQEISNFQQPHLSRSDDEERNRDKSKLFGLDINDLELDVSKKIPKIIVEAVNYFKLNEDHLKEQGIFRKAPREYDINELEKELIKKNYNAMSSCDDPHVVASCLKRVLSKMPEPIFPFKSYDKIKQLIHVKDNFERKQRVQLIVDEIPELNARVIRTIIDLLRVVQQYSDQNLMKMEALTKIFAPTLIRGPSKTEKMEEAIEELMMNPTVVDVIQLLFINYDEIFRKIELLDQNEFHDNNNNDENNNIIPQIFKKMKVREAEEGSNNCTNNQFVEEEKIGYERGMHSSNEEDEKAHQQNNFNQDFTNISKTQFNHISPTSKPRGDQNIIYNRNIPSESYNSTAHSNQEENQQSYQINAFSINSLNEINVSNKLQQDYFIIHNNNPKEQQQQDEQNIFLSPQNDQDALPVRDKSQAMQISNQMELRNLLSQL